MNKRDAIYENNNEKDIILNSINVGTTTYEQGYIHRHIKSNETPQITSKLTDEKKNQNSV